MRAVTAERAAGAARPQRLSAQHVQLALVGLWVVTRVVLLVVSLNPRLYSAALFGDVRLYGAKVERMFQGEVPYRDVAIACGPPSGWPG